MIAFFDIILYPRDCRVKNIKKLISLLLLYYFSEEMKFPKFICIIDFEATCDNKTERKHEIIEFPAVLLKFQEGKGGYKKISEIQFYCKPKEDATISRFCFELTGISQSQINTGIPFPMAIDQHIKWLNSYAGSKQKVICLTCGDWDLKWMMKEECDRWEITKPDVYNKYINIKAEFQRFYNLPKKIDMVEMLNEINLDLIGKHHSGLDDCNNIARIWMNMIELGYEMNDESIINLR